MLLSESIAIALAGAVNGGSGKCDSCMVYFGLQLSLVKNKADRDVLQTCANKLKFAYYCSCTCQLNYGKPVPTIIS